VVDAAIVDGAAHLDAMTMGLRNAGLFSEQRGANLLDGGAPFYDVYPTSDGRHVAVGALEPQFFAAFVDLLGVAEECPDQDDLARWGQMRDLFARTLASRTQAEWTELFEGTDACVAPVLAPSEAVDHPHLAARGTYADHDGVRQPAPAPRFSRTAPTLRSNPPAAPGEQTREALTAWGVDDVDGLLARGAVHQA
jgi:alpha-methylacyl-CoA racemase